VTKTGLLTGHSSKNDSVLGLLHSYQLHLKYQDRIARDRPLTIRAIPDTWWHDKQSYATNFHAFERLFPTCDNFVLTLRKRKCLQLTIAACS